MKTKTAKSKQRANILRRLRKISEGLQLSYANIHVMPINMDWQLEAGLDNESWSVIEPEWDRESAVKFLEYHCQDVNAADDDDEVIEQARGAWTDHESGIPMMNYYYPIELLHGLEVEKLQLKMELEGMATTLVLVNDEPAIVLTGGGMDLSWDICWGFILCGCYPPAHFCRLPEFAGRQPSDRNLMILAACSKTLECVKLQTTRSEEYLDGILDALVKEAEKKEK
jgi:hypothetical protein